MKILEIKIKNFRQFKDLTLDFKDLNGNPLKKICFIGRNGTGKSTLLELIKDILNNNFLPYQKENITIITTEETINMSSFSPPDLPHHNLNLQDNPNNLLIYSPPETISSIPSFKNNLPETNLSKAIPLFDNFPFYHKVSEEDIHSFWTNLIYLIKKRDNEREVFENEEENLDKTKKQLIMEFDEKYPKILNKIAILWNKILEPANLEFDLENVSNPIQLNDNLKAYIKLKSTNKRINYNQLSTGIRNFIFKIGHIYSLYFNRVIENAFLLVDEPENSLFPDFLFDLIEIYEEIIIDKNGKNNTQFFTATHNPIIASQFEPYERIILEWNEQGYVESHKGISPIGDDPNDLLNKDFKLRNLMGKEGIKAWKRFIELKTLIPLENNKNKKNKLIDEYSQLGLKYNFPAIKK